MRRRSWLRWTVGAGLLIVLAVNSAEALYLSGKALLAQHLLLTAWETSQETQQAAKPWPWADIHPAGLLQVPQRGIRQVALNGHSGEALAFGPGAVAVEDAVMLGGHRDSHFRFVRQLELGETLFWQPLGKESRAYHVTAMEVINSAEQELIIPPPDTLLLVTCFPFDALNSGGPLRYVVVATPVTRF